MDELRKILRESQGKKYGTKLDATGVDSWLKSVSDLGTRAYTHLSKEGYKQNEKELLDEIDSYLSSKGDVEHYLRANKSSIKDYDKVYQSYIDTVNNLRSLRNNLQSSNRVYSQWANEGEYNTWYEEYQKQKAEQEEYLGMINSEQATTGWQTYLDDVAKAQETEAKEKEEMPWWERILGYLGNTGVTDTSVPLGNMPQIIDDIRNDTSYKTPNDNWTDEQRKVYGYLYAEDINRATEYAISTNEYNNKVAEEEALKKIAEASTSGFWAGVGNTIGAIASAPLGLADYLNDLAYANAGREIPEYDGTVSPFEYSQGVTSGITTNLNNKYGTIDEDVPVFGGKGWGDVYGLGVSIAQSMASAYTLGGAGTLISYFGQGAASGVDDALKRGATDGQAMLYGTALGVFEGLAEMIGVDRLFKLGSTSTVKGFIKNILNQAGAEGMEEGITSFLSAIADNAIMQDKSNFNALVEQYMAQGMSESEAKKKAWLDSVGGIAFDTITGAVSGSVSGGIHTTAQNAMYNKAAKNHGQSLIKTEGGVDALKALALDMTGASSDVDTLAKKVNKNASAKNVGKLSFELESSITSQNRTEIEKALIEKGLSKKDAKRVSEYLGGFKKLTEEQKAEINGNEKIKAVVDKLVDRADSDISERNKSLFAARMGATYKSDTKAIKEKVSKEGKTVQNSTGEEIVINKADPIASIEKKDGKRIVTLNTDKGKIDSADISYATEEEAFIYESFVDLNPETANAIIKNYDGKMPVQNYIKGMRDGVILYGMHNFQGVGKDISSKSYFAELSETDQAYALNLGRSLASIDAKNADEASLRVLKEAVDKAREAKGISKDAPLNGTAKKGVVGFEHGASIKITEETTKEEREEIKKKKKVVSLAKHLASALGINILFYDSTIEGTKYSDSNGYYDEITDTIHIDIKSMETDKKFLAYTLSHELVHWLKKHSETDFNNFAKFLMEQYASHGVDTEALLKAQMANNGYNSDEAYEEMICEACETLLLDTNAVEKLIALRQTNLTLFEKIKNFIRNLLDKIRGEYKKYGDDINLSDEAKALLGMTDVLEQIYAKFEEAMVGAAKNAQMEQSLMAESVSVTTDGTIKMQMKQYRQTGRSTLLNYLTEQYGRDNANDLISTIDSIYDTLAEIKEDTALTVFGNWQDTDVELDENGHPIFTTSIKNGDYELNQDFSRVCKKRRQLNFVLNMLAEDPAFEASNLTKEDFVKINEAIKSHGFEIACALCFVDSKRFRQTEWADSFANTWNDILNSVVDDSSKLTPFNFATKNPNLADDGIKIDTSKAVTYRKWSDGKEDVKNRRTYKSFDQMLTKGSNGKFLEGNANVRAIVTLIRDNPSLRHTFRGADIIASDGFDSIQRLAPGIRSILDGWGGTSVPKPSSNDAIYDNSILNIKGYNAEKAFAVGGVRMNSFSDFMAHMFFDYAQAFADLSAKGLPMHSYTKELDFARLFGLTGGKINMSAIAAIRSNATDIDKIKKKADKEKATEFEKSIAGLDISRLAEKLGKAESEITYDDVIKNLDDVDYVWADESINVQSATLLQSGILYDNLTEGQAAYCYELIRQGKFDEAYKVAGKENVNKGYAKNLGIIAVGVSKAHILKLMRDPTIRMVIPYHKSGLNAAIAKALKIAFYDDFTDVQNTTFKQGDTKVGISKDGAKIGGKNLRDFSFYDWFGKTVDGVFYDGKATASKYLEWCENGTYDESVGDYVYYFTDGSYILASDLHAQGIEIEAKFSEFASEENYYKVIEDFDCYDTITGEHSSQEAVDIFHDGLPSDYKKVLVRALKAEQKVSDDFKDHLDNKGLRNEVMDIVKARGYKPSVKKQAKTTAMYDYSDGEYSKAITIHDVEVLRSITRKSINKFTSEDIKKAQKWAYKFYKDLGVKSPFFRAWFGEWRAHDNKTQVVVVDIPNVATEKQRSLEGIIVKDTQNDNNFWKVRISGHGERNTHAHAGNKMKSVAGLTNIKGLMENAILLDSEVHEHHDNNAVNDYIAFDHKFYALGKNERGGIALYKITVEETFQSKTNTNDMRFHNLRYIKQIEKVADNVSGSSNSNNKNQPYTARDVSTTKYSVADLYKFVKRFDTEFTPAPEISSAAVKLLLNKDGNPKVYYHGTKADFDVFDKSKLDDEFGFYFTEDIREARDYGTPHGYYLTIRNPIDIYSDEYYNKYYEIKDASQRVKALQNDGYDGVSSYSHGVQWMIAFEPTQIKSATDNIGTFDPDNPKIKFQKKKVSDRTILANALESTIDTSTQAGQNELKKLKEYKEAISEIEKLDAHLAEVKAQIHDISFNKDTDRSKLTALNDEKIKTQNRISIYDKTLTRLEAMKPIKDVLNREKELVRKATEERGREELKAERDRLMNVQKEQIGQVREARDRAVERVRRQKLESEVAQRWEVAEMREQMEKLRREMATAVGEERQKKREAIDELRAKRNETIRELMDKFKDSRHKDVERRTKTEVRHKIRKVIGDLRHLLVHGTKERNVKQEMQSTVASFLALGEALFNDSISNADIVRIGVKSATETEAQYLKEYKEALDKIESLQDEITSIREATSGEERVKKVAEKNNEIGKLKSKISRLNGELADVFVRERAMHNRVTIDELIGRLAEEYATLKNSENEYIKAAYDDDVYNRLDALKKDIKGNIVKDMTLEQLEEVYKAFKMVKHKVYTANSIFREGKTEDLMKRTSAVQEEIFSHKKDKRDPVAKTDDAVSTIKGFVVNEMKPLTAFEYLGSDAFKELFMDAVNADGVWARIIDEAGNYLQEQRAKYHYAEWDMGKTKEFKLADGKIFKLTLGDIMSIYAYSKRDDGKALDHMIEGGFVFDENNRYVGKLFDGKSILGKISVKRKHARLTDTYQVGLGVLNEIVRLMDTKEYADVKAYTDAMQEYFRVMGEMGNKVSQALYGIDLFTEKFYIPLQSHSDYLNSNKEAQSNAETQVSLRNMGMTKATVPGARNPIVLRQFDDLWLEHIDKMAKYCAYVLPIENIQRVWNSVYQVSGTSPMSTKALVASIFGNEVKAYFDQYIKDLNGGANGASGYKSPLASMFSKFKKTAVGAKLSVVVQQPFAILRAMDEIRPDYFVPFLHGIAKTEKVKVYEELREYAPVAIVKEIGGFDIGSSSSTKNYIGTTEYHGVKGKVKGLIKDSTYRNQAFDDAIMIGATKADELGWSIIWLAVKKEVADTGKYTPGSKEFLEACGKRFTEVVLKTQVYDSVNSRSGLMRSKSDTMKFMTSFAGEPTTIVNMFVSKYISLARAIKSGDKKQIAKEVGKMSRTLGVVTTSIVLTTLAKAAIYANYDDDEDESWMERWMRNFGDSLSSDLNPLTMIPILRDLVSVWEGWTLERPDMALLADLTESIKNILEETEEGAVEMETVYDLIGDIANAFGIPVKNIVKDIKGIVNLIQDHFDSINTISAGDAFVRGWTDEEQSKTEGLFEAIMSGDTDKIEYYKNSYKDKSDYETALRKALRDNDPRIQEAAMALIKGDTATRVSIIKEIIAEGYFTQDIVLGAVNNEAQSFTSDIKKAQTAKNNGEDAEYKKIVKSLLKKYPKDFVEKKLGELIEVKEESEDKDKSVSYFTMDDYYKAVTSGGYSSSEIKNDLIETAMANGKSREEAEDSFNSSFRTYLRDEYKDGNVTRSNAMEMLIDYGGMESDDAYWKMKEWDYYVANNTTEGYSKYTEFYDAVKTGRNLKAVIKEYTDHGVKTSTLSSQITSYYKPIYRQMTPSERASLKGYLLNAYALLGYNRYEKSQDINKWLED